MHWGQFSAVHLVEPLCFSYPSPRTEEWAFDKLRPNGGWDAR